MGRSDRYAYAIIAALGLGGLVYGIARAQPPPTPTPTPTPPPTTTPPPTNVATIELTAPITEVEPNTNVSLAATPRDSTGAALAGVRLYAFSNNVFQGEAGTSASNGVLIFTMRFEVEGQFNVFVSENIFGSA